MKNDTKESIQWSQNNIRIHFLFIYLFFFFIETDSLIICKPTHQKDFGNDYPIQNAIKSDNQITAEI